MTLNFTFWGNDDRASRYQQAIDLFNEEYTDISITSSFAAFADYWPARTTEAAGRALPDVMQFDLSYLREFSENGQLLDLAPYVENETIDLSGYDETLLEAGVLDGKTIGIPTSTNTLAMFENPNVTQAAGATFPDDADYSWEDLNGFIEDVSASGTSTADGYQLYGSGDYTGTFWFFIQWLLQNGVTPFNEDGTLGFDEADVVEFLGLTADLREADQLYPVERATSLLPKGGFTVNEVASEMSWDNFLTQYTTDSGTDNLEMHQLPSIEPGEKALFYKPSMLLSAGANTEHPVEAALFINFLLTDPEVGTIFGTSKGVPADEEQRAAVDVTEGSVDAKVIAYEEEVAEQVTEATPIPVKGFGTIEAKWRTLAEELAYGNLDPEGFATEWFAEAEMAIS
ncbi:ABC transporter substrate-binding protein [Cellulomonas marina]|uniref:Multiple sugar transport system substrate-binding protein n=1 Tax=Cellulomonas marina TaxID=988821 RepID=A0A1I0WSW7_9CELL|nr:extracellular solute-binding protein [Cellulomonas marina]GIG27846.1 sugar ABC transporter substrate-binding protein [Cellulomonas marina]SFA91517.1 multiple sugar transport system substrate-binding protein [Cellulomonas marina]